MKTPLTKKQKQIRRQYTFIQGDSKVFLKSGVKSFQIVTSSTLPKEEVEWYHAMLAIAIINIIENEH